MIKKLCFIFFILFWTTTAEAQVMVSSRQYHATFSAKMKDSLKLTNIEFEGIEKVNNGIEEKKAKAWRDEKNRVELQKLLQSIERTRDTLYSSVLPPDKYLLYKKIKGSLIKSN